MTAESYHADRLTDMTKLIVTLRNFFENVWTCKAHLHTIVYLLSILTKIDMGRQISVKTQNFTKTLPAEQPLFQDDGRTDDRWNVVNSRFSELFSESA
jgi:hypothetical protein